MSLAAALLLVTIAAASPEPMTCRGPALRYDASTRESLGIEAPGLTKKSPLPEVPEIVRKRQVKVVIQLEGIVDLEGLFCNGVALSCEVTQGATMIPGEPDVCGPATDAALAAVRQWTFRPATRRGEPACVYHQVRVPVFGASPAPAP